MATENETPEYHLRVATPEDRPRLVALINAAFAVEDFMEGTRTDEARLSATMKSGEILIAETKDGRLMGSVYLENRGSHGYMGLLAVDPSHQGRGLGRALTHAVEARFKAQGCEAVDIFVLKPRTELPPYYEKLGYQVTGIEEFKPSRKPRPGVDCRAVTMTKKL